MFGKLYNQATLSAHLVPDGPVLIVEGGPAPDPLAPDLAFVRTTVGGESTVYLPGSSLKGVLRAHAERLLATEVGEEAAEDPFRLQSPPHRKKAKDAKDAGRRPEVYRASCPADRLFGSTLVAGRLRVGDAVPTPESRSQANQTSVRYGVGIDREKQSTRPGVLFEQEAVVDGRFVVSITLENYELWMLALLLQVVADLHAGLVQVGHAKSRGFGTVKVEKPKLVVRVPGPAPARLEGAGAREGDAAVRAAWGLDEADWIELPAGAEAVALGLASGHRLAGWEALGRLTDELSTGPWQRFLEHPFAGAADTGSPSPGGPHAP